MTTPSWRTRAKAVRDTAEDAITRVTHTPPRRIRRGISPLSSQSGSRLMSWSFHQPRAGGQSAISWPKPKPGRVRSISPPSGSGALLT